MIRSLDDMDEYMRHVREETAYPTQ